MKQFCVPNRLKAIKILVLVSCGSSPSKKLNGMNSMTNSAI